MTDAPVAGLVTYLVTTSTLPGIGAIALPGSGTTAGIGAPTTSSPSG